MIWIAKIVGAWLFASAAGPMILQVWSEKRAAPGDLWEGVVGMGLVVSLSMLLFALVIALPLSVFIMNTMAPLAATLLYPFLLALVAWLICTLILPDGWQGAGQALMLFAFVMGTGWSLLSLVTLPSATFA